LVGLIILNDLGGTESNVRRFAEGVALSEMPIMLFTALIFATCAAFAIYSVTAITGAACAALASVLLAFGADYNCGSVRIAY
jgi:hypothetical protein